MQRMFQTSGQKYSENFHSIEQDARAYWQERQIYRASDNLDADYKYILGMFPYPSGNAHMGHAFVYSITDTISRLRRLKGDNVLHPLGWDAFGLPAENAANQHGVSPDSWTQENVRSMQNEQLSKLGLSFDSERTLNTSLPEYYKWTQWLFLQLNKAGLVYRAEEWVNWDPVDQTVLANEQVVDGKGWRSKAPIERKKMAQWYVRITAYAEDLYQGLERLDQWSDAAVNAQKYWIGRKEGLDISFQINDLNDKSISAFTTRPEFLYGAQALLVAPENEDIDELISDNKLQLIKKYRQSALVKSDVERQSSKEKTAIDTGLTAVHPLTQEIIPIFMSENVVASHGVTAEIMTPAHNGRDLELSKQIELEAVNVVKGSDVLPDTATEGLLDKSGRYSNLSFEEAAEEITQDLIALGSAKRSIRYKLKDWAIGRQRFWGAPIPMLETKTGEFIPEAEERLPVRLPDSTEIDTFGANLSLDLFSDFKFTEGENGEILTRDVDTMDTFMCSSWYAWRFLNPDCDTKAWDPEEAKKWMPLDTYVGGLEHANQHLIYFRFMSYFLHDQGLTPTREPVQKFLNNGMVLMGGEKMSKSKGNVVRPDDMVKKYGADALHLYILSNGPYDRNFEWDESGLRHKQAFINRIQRLYADIAPPEDGDFYLSVEAVDNKFSQNLLHSLNETAASIEKEILDNNNFHVAIGKIHEFVNTLSTAKEEVQTEEQKQVYDYVASNFLKMLGLFAPHISEHLWQTHFDPTQSLFEQSWVHVDQSFLYEKEDRVSITVMVNGKRRGSIEIANDADDKQIIDAITLSEETSLNKYFNDVSIGKTVVVRDRKAGGLPKMVNIQVLENN